MRGTTTRGSFLYPELWASKAKGCTVMKSQGCLHYLNPKIKNQSCGKNLDRAGFATAFLLNWHIAYFVISNTSILVACAVIAFISI